MTIPRPLAQALLVVPWLMALTVVGWIAIKRFPPNGVFVVTSNFEAGSLGFVKPFLPGDRVTPPGVQEGGWIGQSVIGDPVYFNVRVPGPYERAFIDVDFRPVRQPLVEFGVVTDPASNDVQLQPLYASELESPGWTPVKGGFVREGVEPARLQSTDPAGIALWHASATVPLEMDARPATATHLDVSLRGAHDFYLVPAAGTVDIRFGIQDVNRTVGRKPVVIRVFRGEDVVHEEVVATGGSRDVKMGQVFPERVHLSNVGPGVYRVSLVADDDVFIRWIETMSRRWVVGPRLSFGDEVGYATSVRAVHAWTTSQHILAQTFHREGLQTVTLGRDAVTLARTHELFRLDATEPPTVVRELVAPRGDVRLIGDGFFALTSSAFFLPKPERFTDGTDTTREGIVAVKTPYSHPEALGDGWYRAHIQTVLDPTQDTLRFVLSAPGITSRLGAVDVGRVTLTFRRPPLSWGEWWQLIDREARNAWHRL